MVVIEKQDIDNYFSRNNEKLLSSIKKIKIKNQQKNNWEPEELLSESYEFLVQNAYKMEKQQHIEAFWVKFINGEIKWERSKTNRMYNHPFLDYTDEIKGDREEDNQDLEDKIRLENDFNEKMAIIYEFYNTLETLEERIIFDAIFNKGLTTLKKLVEHFKINKNYLQIRRKKLMDNLKEYAKNKA